MLSNENIRVRFVEEKDLEEFTHLKNDLDIRGVYLPCELTSPQKTRQQFMENGLSTKNSETMLIVDTDDRLLGTIWHFVSVPYFNAREIGYTLFDVNQRGKGIVSQAVGLLSDYLFGALHINRLEIRMDSNNLASERIAIKCGFEKEGTSRGASYVRGKHVDMHVYAMLREEWASSR
jgi:ribosomal-protein-alanine N-acetyltransferase